LSGTISEASEIDLFSRISGSKGLIIAGASGQIAMREFRSKKMHPATPDIFVNTASCIHESNGKAVAKIGIKQEVDIMKTENRGTLINSAYEWIVEIMFACIVLSTSAYAAWTLSTSLV
jgi:hypothetical protein